MRLGFPQTGNLYVPIKTLLRELNVDFVMPPPLTRRTMSLGVKNSPEGVCLPFKLTLGNMIEVCELGADTLVQVRGFGVCRLGYYAKVQEQILRDLGFSAELMRFSVSEGNKLFGFLKVFKRLGNNAPWPKVISAYRFGMGKLHTIDELERAVQRTRAVELEKGKANRVFKEAIEAVDQAGDHGSLRQVKRDYLEKLQQIPRDAEARPLRVGVVGEIYVVLEPFAAMDLESELGKLGAVVERKISYSHWTTCSFYLNPLGIDEWKDVHKAAWPYLKRDVGGDGWESVGEKVLHNKDYDGIVHVAPFSCLPEVVAQNIMARTKEQIPVLSITCDEQMGKAGLLTRLEAFVDLLQRRRRHEAQMRAG